MKIKKKSRFSVYLMFLIINLFLIFLVIIQIFKTSADIKDNHNETVLNSETSTYEQEGFTQIYNNFEYKNDILQNNRTMYIEFCVMLIANIFPIITYFFQTEILRVSVSNIELNAIYEQNKKSVADVFFICNLVKDSITYDNMEDCKLCCNICLDVEERGQIEKIMINKFEIIFDKNDIFNFYPMIQKEKNEEKILEKIPEKTFDLVDIDDKIVFVCVFEKEQWAQFCNSCRKNAVKQINFDALLKTKKILRSRISYSSSFDLQINNSFFYGSCSNEK